MGHKTPFPFLIWLCLLCVLSAPAFAREAGAGKEVAVQVDSVNETDVRKWLEQDEPFRVLDVRSRSEYEHDGHVPDALLHPWNMEQDEQATDLFLQSVSADLDKEQRIVVLCSRGGRATRAARALRQAGFSNVVVFAGGYEGSQIEGIPSGAGWKAASLPLDPGVAAPAPEPVDGDRN